MSNIHKHMSHRHVLVLQYICTCYTYRFTLDTYIYTGRTGMYTSYTNTYTCYTCKYTCQTCRVVWFQISSVYFPHQAWLWLLWDAITCEFRIQVGDWSRRSSCDSRDPELQPRSSEGEVMWGFPEKVPPKGER